MNYLRFMANDGRLLAIYGIGFMTFSVCNNYTPYEEKGIWDYLPHNPKGRICFIEKAVFKKWTLSLRKQITNEIYKRFPQIEETIWFRPTKGDDRKITYRRHHETSLRN